MSIKMSLWHYGLGLLVSRLYYRISVSGAAVDLNTPTLYLASHRNGAIDGCVYLNALHRTPSLVSVQLLRHLWQRVFFCGIPVVREKDRLRYGIGKNSVPSPIQAAVEHIRQGGSLVIFPEGSSEFGEKPQPYHKGMGLIVMNLKALGVRFQVQPLGCFYTAPECFRSRADIMAGEAFVPQSDELHTIQAELGAALNRVSVCCRDTKTFNRVQRAAFAAAQRTDRYASAFLALQQSEISDAETAVPEKSGSRLANCIISIIFLPTALACRWATRFADERNNISLFRSLAAVAALPFQAAYWGVLAWIHVGIPAVFILTAALLWHHLSEPHPIDL